VLGTCYIDRVQILVATGADLVRVADGVAEAVLADQGIRCVAVGGGAVWAGGSTGTWVSADGGATWERGGLEADVFSLAVGADGAVYAGTEPSALFRHEHDGWVELEALQELPSRPTWSFPPRPWTSHVRAIAPSPHDPRLLLVGIELGGLMRSTDGGASWADHRPGAQRDVHALAWHPVAPGRAYEAGGGGAAWSHDGGASWQAADDGRDRDYTWALAVAPHDPDVWLVSASTGPGAAHGGGDPRARLYRREGDAPWRPLDGAPTSSMPYALSFAADGTLVLGLLDGRLYTSSDRGDAWRAVEHGGDLTRLAALAVADR
jgi:photosystem II stability/assembly factor-like uncharacterized protein